MSFVPGDDVEFVVKGKICARGVYLRATGGGTWARVKLTHVYPETWGFNSYVPGDEVDLFLTKLHRVSALRLLAEQA